MSKPLGKELLEKRSSVLMRLRLALSFALVILIGSAGYYYLHVQKKSEYLESRNFRLLAAMGRRVEGSVEGQGRVLENLTKKEELIQALEILTPQEAADGKAESSTTPAGGKSEADPEQKAKKESALKDKKKILTALVPLLEDVEMRREAAQGGGRSYRLEPDRDGYVLKLNHHLPEEKRTFLGSVKFKALLDTGMGTRGAFETVLLADSQGHVLYQEGATHLGITQLSAFFPDRRTGKEPKDRKQREEEERTPLVGYSEHRKVELAGRTYRLFVKPFTLPIHSPRFKAEGGSRAQEEIWLICGLVPESVHFYTGMAVSSSLMTLLLAILLLGLLSWPFAKLRLLGERQRIRPLDVLLVGICSLLGASILTVLVLDSFAFSTLGSQAGDQVETLATGIEERLRKEIIAAYDQLVKLEEEAEKVPGAREASKRNHPNDLRQYPFWTIFSLMDDEGMQRVKWTTNTVAPAPIKVGRREYFQRARNDELWTLREGPSLYVDAIVSWTSGERVATISKKAESGRHGTQVSALTIPMLSLIHPVLPPGFDFVVIDSDDPEGRVLFHSDPGRNLSESFFAETDQDRRLRSAVFAKRSETMTLRYWGNDYIARVEPVEDIPWTIIVLRDKKLLRAVNLEWIVTTVFFLLLYCSLIAALLFGALSIRPAHRSGWLWPDLNRRRGYADICKLLLALAAVFILAIYGLPGGYNLFVTSIILPLLAIVVAYLRVCRWQERAAAAVVCGCALLVLLGLALLAGSGEEGGQLWLRLSIVALAGLVLAAAVLLLRRDKKREDPTGKIKEQSRQRFRTRDLYVMAGLLLLVSTAVLPTLGFFESAHRIHFDSFIKHGQLRLALSLKERGLRVRRDVRREKSHDMKRFLDRRLAVSAAEEPKWGGMDVYSLPFFGTTISRADTANGQGEDCLCEPNHGSKAMAELFEALLPRASETAVEMRELMHRAASDCTWHWHGNAAEGNLVLHSKSDPRGGLALASSAGRAPTYSPVVQGFLSSIAVLLLLMLLMWLVLFVARNLFLLEPDDTLLPAGSPAPFAGRNLFLVNRHRDWRMPDLGEHQRIDLRLLRDTAHGSDRLRQSLRDARDGDVVVDGFGERMQDDAFQERVLKFLERLVSVHPYRVVVRSTEYPEMLFAPEKHRRIDPVDGGAASTQERWRRLLSSFVLFDEDLRSYRQVGEEIPAPASTEATAPPMIKSKLLREECGGNPALLRIGSRLDKTAGSRTREQLLEEFGEEAAVYYRKLWASCSPEEEVVLGHLAEDGFVNEKNRRTVRRLIARELVRRDPNLRLMNETFRRFVVSSICKSEVRAVEQEAEPSAWDKLRLPLFVGLATSLVFFFTTQQALLDGAAGTITGIAAGVPALIQMIDLMGAGRFPGR